MQPATPAAGKAANPLYPSPRENFVLQLIDTTLSNLLYAQLVLSEEYHIYFTTPDADFPGTVSLPALNLFLYSVVKNRDLRNVGNLRQLKSDGSVQILTAPVRVDCHYLITAWAESKETTVSLHEHYLLGECMRVLFRYPEIPAEYWASPSLEVQGFPLHTETALPTTHQMGIDLWQSLGQKPRACFHYKVTANLDIS